MHKGFFRRLLDQVSIVRRRNFSPNTVKSCRFWIRRFILFHGKCHPLEMGIGVVGASLNHVAVDRRVATATT